MNHRMLLQQTINLTLIVLLLAGCGGKLTEPTVTPIPIPYHSTLAADKRAGIPASEKDFVFYTVPGMDQVTLANIKYRDELTMDVYYPPDFDFTQNLPVVIFVNGFVGDWHQKQYGTKLKDYGQYISWGQLIAASGMTAITYDTHDPEVSIHDLINYTRANGPWLRINEDRICLWACSANSATA